MVKKPKRKPSQGVVVPPVFKTILAFLQFISPYLGMRWAAYFFGRPKRYKLQPREISVFNKSRRFLLEIEPLKKKIICYHWEGSGPKILLVHGWSGRAVNFCKIIEKLMEYHCDLYAFDAPAHGMSEGTTTNLPQFIACIDALVDNLDSIDCILGHSGGGFAAAYHAAHRPQLKKLIIISSFDYVLDVFQNFSQWVQLGPKATALMIDYFEQKTQHPIKQLSISKLAKNIKANSLLIHDENDKEVGFDQALLIKKQLSNATFLPTQNLGHRRILRDQKVVEQIANFIV
jgi:pimeloyl-ACP methyl ester carboxylesterase